jgi:hypothetical protein
VARQRTAELKTVCDCGAQMLRAAANCGFCQLEAILQWPARSPRPCLTFELIHQLTPDLPGIERKRAFDVLPASVQDEAWTALAAEESRRRAEQGGPVERRAA